MRYGYYSYVVREVIIPAVIFGAALLVLLVGSEAFFGDL